MNVHMTERADSDHILYKFCPGNWQICPENLFSLSVFFPQESKASQMMLISDGSTLNFRVCVIHSTLQQELSGLSSSLGSHFLVSSCSFALTVSQKPEVFQLGVHWEPKKDSFNTGTSGSNINPWLSALMSGKSLETDLFLMSLMKISLSRITCYHAMLILTWIVYQTVWIEKNVA